MSGLPKIVYLQTIGKLTPLIYFEVPDQTSQITASLYAMKEEVLDAAQKGAKAVADGVYLMIHQNISLTSPSYAELNALGNPFRAKDPLPVGSLPIAYPYQVVDQPRVKVGSSETGPEKLLSALEITPYRGENSVGFLVGIDSDRAAHVKHIIYGTRTMIARDFISGSFDQFLATVDAFSLFAQASKKFSIQSKGAGSFTLIDL